MAQGSKEGGRVIWTPDQVTDTFPFLNERWIHADHALVYGGERVPNYNEKIDIAGGIDTIRALLKDIHPNLRKRFLLVLGFEGTPLPFSESRLFAEKTDVPSRLSMNRYDHGIHSRDVEMILRRGPTILARVDPNLIAINRIKVSGMGIAYAIDRPTGYIANPGASGKFANTLS